MSLLAEKEIHGEGWIDGHGEAGSRLYESRRWVQQFANTDQLPARIDDVYSEARKRVVGVER